MYYRYMYIYMYLDIYIYTYIINPDNYIYIYISIHIKSPITYPVLSFGETLFQWPMSLSSIFVVTGASLVVSICTVFVHLHMFMPTSLCHTKHKSRLEPLGCRRVSTMSARSRSPPARHGPATEREAVLQEVQAGNFLALQDASGQLRSDRGFVLAAVRVDGRALRGAFRELRRCSDMRKAAVRASWGRPYLQALRQELRVFVTGDPRLDERYYDKYRF